MKINPFFLSFAFLFWLLASMGLYSLQYVNVMPDAQLEYLVLHKLPWPRGAIAQTQYDFSQTSSYILLILGFVFIALAFWTDNTTRMTGAWK